MASGFYLQGRLAIAQQSCQLTGADIKLMLVKSTYTVDITQNFVTTIAASEADCTGYTGGFAGAGRHTIDGPPAWARDDANTRIEFDFNDELWSTLGNGTNNTLGFVGLIREITNDAASYLIGVDDTNDVTTNGGNVTYAPNVEGMLQW